jgi:hypothetical protein
MSCTIKDFYWSQKLTVSMYSPFGAAFRAAGLDIVLDLSQIDRAVDQMIRTLLTMLHVDA